MLPHHVMNVSRFLITFGLPNANISDVNTDGR